MEAQPLSFNTEEAAELVGLSVRTLQSRRSRGEGPPFIRVGRLCLYRYDDLKAWLDRQTPENEGTV